MKRAGDILSLRGDTINIGSFLTVISLCLAITIVMGLRLAGIDAHALAARLDGSMVTQANARQPSAARADPAEAPALEVPVDQAQPSGADETAPAARSDPAAPSLPAVVSHGNRASNMVALTFDSNMTPAMLRELDRGTVKRFVNDRVITELRELKVPATFFLSGLWMERYLDVARDIGGDPLFEVGSHSYSHLGFRANCFGLGLIDLPRAADDLERNHTVLAGVAAHPTNYFRFPGGCYDPAAMAAVRPTGVQVIQYDVASGDAFETRPAAIISHTTASVKSGSIVVMHITGGNTAPMTDRALPEVVKQLRARGYQLVRLSDLLQQGGAG
ncbi:MAG: polysaccharide deacetylase family protein [Candidatus Dormibacteraeota bacterium]|nr:polysaccharide deacetylase family protein [Candidatus Dormibacteraeota bacterium]